MAKTGNKDYRFALKDKDPMIDLIRSEVQAQYGSNMPRGTLTRISEKSGVSVSTLEAWFFGDTRHPHYLTYRFVLEALDCRFQVVRTSGEVVRGSGKI